MTAADRRFRPDPIGRAPARTAAARCQLPRRSVSMRRRAWGSRWMNTRGRRRPRRAEHDRADDKQDPCGVIAGHHRLLTSPPGYLLGLGEQVGRPAGGGGVPTIAGLPGTAAPGHWVR